MDHEESILVRALTERANARILSGETTLQAMQQSDEMERIAQTVLMDSPDLLPGYAEKIATRARKAAKARRSHDIKTRKNILKRFWQSFSSFEEIISIAEVGNRIQFDGLMNWLKVDSKKKLAPPFRESDIAGGVGTKCLMLNSLEARAIVVAQEVLALLSIGFTEAARSRTRTLHEIFVIAATIAVGSRASTGYTLSDRYHLSSLIEQRRLGASTPRARKLIRMARASWGDDFFDQYGWARPVLTLRHRERPTFAHIEKYVTQNARRHLYVEFNNSVHAGAMNTVSRTDFRLHYPHYTRSDCDIAATNRILHAASLYLSDCASVIIRDVCTETDNYDDAILIGILNRKITPLHEYLSSQADDIESSDVS